MPSADIITFKRPNTHLITKEYTGIIRHHHASGTGLIEFRSPPELRGHTAPYTAAAIYLTDAHTLYQVDMPVEGQISHDFPQTGWNIRTVEPFGGVGPILSPDPPTPLWCKILNHLGF